MAHDPRLAVLFVCLGNICRSPTAEGVFRAALVQVGLAEHVFADSAGIGDWHVGSPPDRRAIQAARRRGYDLTALRGRQVERCRFHALRLDPRDGPSNLRALEEMRPPVSTVISDCSSISCRRRPCAKCPIPTTVVPTVRTRARSRGAGECRARHPHPRARSALLPDEYATRAASRGPVAVGKGGASNCESAQRPTLRPGDLLRLREAARVKRRKAGTQPAFVVHVAPRRSACRRERRPFASPRSATAPRRSPPSADARGAGRPEPGSASTAGARLEPGLDELEAGVRAAGSSETGGNSGIGRGDDDRAWGRARRRLRRSA